MSIPTFSVCLICKNEAKVLPRLIASLREFQDRGGEICLLDTGSDDGSPDIARKLGCKVEEAGTKFQHTIDKDLSDKINEHFVVDNEAPIVKEGDKYFDFSSARNASAEIASSDWICTVDADEVLTNFDIDAINKILEDQSLSNLEYQFIFAHHPDGTPAIQFIQSKFYNKKKHHWVGRVHEYLHPI